MLAGWVALLAALLYLLLLFAVAHYGDTRGRYLLAGAARPPIYALTLAVYCTSWTFLGSVGLASRSGWDFLPIYLGPIIAIVLAMPLIARIIHIAKSQRITSVADFIGSRYGKSGQVAAVAAIIAVFGTVPYIALQLKAISASLEIIVFRELGHVPSIPGLSALGDISLFVTLVLAAFAIAFGTRHIDATEHQNGLMLAVALESVVKLVAFLIVGAFITYWMFDGLGDLLTKSELSPSARAMLATTPDGWTWLTTTVLAGFAILLLPRQFHVMVVENREVSDLRRAVWQFPLYLILINLFVVPLALAGHIIFPQGGIDRDFLVISLPLEGAAPTIALIAFIGALSAATAMVIVESVACGIMISNDLAMPMLLRRTGLRPREISDDNEARRDIQPAASTMVDTVLTIRRVAVVVMLFLGFAYYRASEQASLATIGLLSFAAVAQLMPAFTIGLFWQRANARGALAGLVAGFVIWFYVLFLPTLSGLGGIVSDLVKHGPFGIVALAPGNLLVPGIPPLAQGVILSLGLNTLLVFLVSLATNASPLERVQASLFTSPEISASGPGFKLWRSAVNVEDLRNTVTRYLGEERTYRAFQEFEAQRGVALAPKQEADAQFIRFSENLLASAIGAASSRLVLSLMLRRRNVSTEAALKLLDDASAAIQHSRLMLQHGLDHTRQGVTVFDRELRLICWNRAFQDLFELPPDLVRFGVGLDEIVGHNAARGVYGPGDEKDMIANRITSLVQETDPQRLFLAHTDRVIEIRSNPLPDGGLVTTYTDITEAVAAEKALEEANASLERRVRARTEELTRVNKELGRAKQEADTANASKTRFLAAASHDIAQPLNAARLYATALLEGAKGTRHAELAGNVEASLDAVEEILSALLEMSRLDAGKLKPEITTFPLDELFRQLHIEFGPVAAGKGVELTMIGSGVHVVTDRRLLRRLLQNLVSNAIKYTIKGRVLVGCRRSGEHIHVHVIDTGIGIPASKQKTIFQEFERLEAGARIERGLGLGLSIVERIVKVLDLRLDLVSQPGKGSRFSLALPMAPALPSVVEPKENPVSGAEGALSGFNVLVIDNETLILEGMRIILTGWGCEVVSAVDAATGLKAMRARKFKPDMMLVDFHLDEGNGIDAIRALRSKLRQTVPATLITADRSPEVRDRAATEDIRLINKPVRPSALRALLAQVRQQRMQAAK
jgi:Na+/proline symporter/signal transduction histidine kinase